MKLTILLMSAVGLVRSQRPTFAGFRPIGYPEVATTEGLGDRFGEVDGTTQRLPIEANGDRDLVDRLSKLPRDQQPFWLLNWQAIEAHKQNPQTYPQKPNTFTDTASSVNSGNSNSNQGASSNFGSNTGFGNRKPNLGAASNFGNQNSAGFGNRNPNLENNSHFGNPNAVGFGNGSPNSGTNSNFGNSNADGFGNGSPNSGTNSNFGNPNAAGFGNGSPNLGTNSNFGNPNAAGFGNGNLNLGGGNSNPNRNTNVIPNLNGDSNFGSNGITTDVNGGQLFTNVGNNPQLGNNVNPNLNNRNSDSHNFNVNPSSIITGNVENEISNLNRFGNSNFETTTYSNIRITKRPNVDDSRNSFTTPPTFVNSGNSNFGNSNTNQRPKIPTVNNRNNFQKDNTDYSALVTDKYLGGIELNTYGL